MNVTFRGFFALAICAAAQIVPRFDATTRHRVEVSMPARLNVQRTSSSLSVSYDLASLRKVKITVGERMTLGMKDEFRVYPKGDARPSQYRNLSEGSMNEKEPNPNLLQSAETLSSVPDGIPAVGKRYVVEHDLILFETDVPAQHMWSPGSGKNYKVLWEEKLQAVR